MLLGMLLKERHSTRAVTTTDRNNFAIHLRYVDKQAGAVVHLVLVTITYILNKADTDDERLWQFIYIILRCMDSRMTQPDRYLRAFPVELLKSFLNQAFQLPSCNPPLPEDDLFTIDPGKTLGQPPDPQVRHLQAEKACRRLRIFVLASRLGLLRHTQPRDNVEETAAAIETLVMEPQHRDGAGGKDDLEWTFLEDDPK